MIFVLQVSIQYSNTNSKSWRVQVNGNSSGLVPRGARDVDVVAEVVERGQRAEARVPRGGDVKLLSQ